jgi:hypothetical protein
MPTVRSKLLGAHDRHSSRCCLDVLLGIQKHDLSNFSRAAHPSLRKLLERQREGYKALTAFDTLPRTIGAILRHTGAGDALLMKDIYDERP